MATIALDSWSSFEDVMDIYTLLGVGSCPQKEILNMKYYSRYNVLYNYQVKAPDTRRGVLVGGMAAVHVVLASSAPNLLSGTTVFVSKSTVSPQLIQLPVFTLYRKKSAKLPAIHLDRALEYDFL